MSGSKLEPAKPKGKMTAYAYFSQICHEQHKQDYPEATLDFGDFSKKCSERWKTMSEDEKRRFHELAEKDKKRYDAEMKEYGGPSVAKKRRVPKDPNAPKRALSSYFLFCQDERPKVRQEYPNYSMTDISKELGKRWSETDQKTKIRYEQLSNKQKERYLKEMVEYKNSTKVKTSQLKENGEDESTSD